MPAGDMSRERAIKEIETVNDLLRQGHSPHGKAGSHAVRSAIGMAADVLGENRNSLRNRVGTPDRAGTWKSLHGLEPDWGLYRDPSVGEDSFAADHLPQQSFIGGPVIEIESRKDNTFLFGAAGDLHAASKYTRWDVRDDLYRQFIEAGAQCSFDTGNWIDGEATFNRYDIEAHGLHRQCEVLARNHPKGLKTYAVWGDDHEGWYVQREGIDVGRYAENEMRAAGHEWTNLGFMEAHILLKNANSGKTASLSVVHPGGGSSYALSYSIQKIVESYEGGEKPAVALYGHYHKLWAGIVRNVWVAQTGCQQDQTPFMRKKRLEAHVGGILIALEQNPRDGSIVSMTPKIIRYFNREYYTGSGRWSKHTSVRMLPRASGAGR